MTKEMTKRTERFGPARDAALSPRLPPLRKLIDKADELAIDKVKRLEDAKIGYAENIQNAHRTLGDLRKLNKPNMRCVKVRPCFETLRRVWLNLNFRTNENASLVRTCFGRGVQREGTKKAGG